MTDKNIGFIGLGVMGQSMAGHILAAGFNVRVYNRTKQKADALVDQGAVRNPGWLGRFNRLATHFMIIFSIQVRSLNPFTAGGGMTTALQKRKYGANCV